MKKLFLPFALLSIVACSSSNDDEPQTNNVSIVGKWYMESAEKYTSKDKKTTFYTPEGCDKKDTHEFKEKDMTSITFASHNNTCIQTDVVTRNYTYDPVSKKFWYEGEEDYPYTISQLTQTNMVIEDRIDDLDGDGINDVIKRYFKRIQ
ncbi:Uncharacterised protein [Chryseobacterium nakagawai]|uniref:Lipocalin-like domain-containing protein n=1 Tax=Chryseobacterium nakagawai TaxID=1241982 RepID=A0AAD0YMJ5_CHRNA|nr:lipocalin family protein [Chryseobacterium nakagawai]AZA92587.1 hypothetical protein EG343_19275 [Chryseobacterium nakagawai]VEH19177.1 Uncharacterised protein [Chryseobacterium nakagawai]